MSYGIFFKYSEIPLGGHLQNKATSNMANFLGSRILEISLYKTGEHGRLNFYFFKKSLMIPKSENHSLRINNFLYIQAAFNIKSIFFNDNCIIILNIAFFFQVRKVITDSLQKYLN
eukprot:TRINITY_DN9996_c0_g1_i1.p4 TRINITY_DN9996_c0_g1~~TRINITY_DN9996_c0_g1_i1.p4  ORF type:complete len:116 (-),score=3.87 TRINITY_DN9996_c0_g1_i1:354-701(-)